VIDETQVGIVHAGRRKPLRRQASRGSIESPIVIAATTLPATHNAAQMIIARTKLVASWSARNS
jgi:hypothetical protein